MTLESGKRVRANEAVGMHLNELAGVGSTMKLELLRAHSKDDYESLLKTKYENYLTKAEDNRKRKRIEKKKKTLHKTLDKRGDEEQYTFVIDRWIDFCSDGLCNIVQPVLQIFIFMLY